MFGVLLFLLLCYGFLFAMLVKTGNQNVEYAIENSKAVASIGYPYWSEDETAEVQAAQTGLNSIVVFGSLFLGALTLLTLYYPFTLFLNRNVEKKEYQGTVSSSDNSYFTGVTLQITYSVGEEKRIISTNSFMGRYCTNCVGASVRFHISQRGMAIIDEI
jgi:hypothetical protein